jgi:hypothetical protein
MGTARRSHSPRSTPPGTTSRCRCTGPCRRTPAPTRTRCNSRPPPRTPSKGEAPRRLQCSCRPPGSIRCTHIRRTCSFPPCTGRQGRTCRTRARHSRTRSSTGRRTVRTSRPRCSSRCGTTSRRRRTDPCSCRTSAPSCTPRSARRRCRIGAPTARRAIHTGPRRSSTRRRRCSSLSGRTAWTRRARPRAQYPPSCQSRGR